MASSRRFGYICSPRPSPQGADMKLSLTRAAVLTAGAALGAMLSFGTSVAQSTSDEETRKAFAAADVNNDGYLDVNEYVAQVIYIFKAIDKNGDGYITVQEWAAYNPGYDPSRFKAIDRDGDGKVSLGEAVGWKMIEFFDIDTNRDGAITVEEIIIYQRKLPAPAATKK